MPRATVQNTRQIYFPQAVGWGWAEEFSVIWIRDFERRSSEHMSVSQNPELIDTARIFPVAFGKTSGVSFKRYLKKGTVWLFNMAMENYPFIDDLWWFTYKNGDFPVRQVK